MTLKGIVIYLLNQAFILLIRLAVGGGGGTAAAAPLPFRLGDPALCRSRPLVTSWYY